MHFQVEFWQFLLGLLTLLGGFGGLLLKVGHILLGKFVEQFEAGLTTRFESLEEAAKISAAAYRTAIAELSRELRELERRLEALKEEVLRGYVRREDQIRDQTVTTAKIDALGARIELLTSMVAKLDALKEPHR